MPNACGTSRANAALLHMCGPHRRQPQSAPPPPMVPFRAEVQGLNAAACGMRDERAPPECRASLSATPRFGLTFRHANPRARASGGSSSSVVMRMPPHVPHAPVAGHTATSVLAAAAGPHERIRSHVHLPRAAGTRGRVKPPRCRCVWLRAVAGSMSLRAVTRRDAPHRELVKPACHLHLILEPDQHLLAAAAAAAEDDTWRVERSKESRRT